MSTEFVKLAPDIVRSSKGFTMMFNPAGGVHYSDAISGKVWIATELIHNPMRHFLHRNSIDVRAMSTSRADEVLVNVKRAMEFLGRPAEIQEPSDL